MTKFIINLLVAILGLWIASIIPIPWLSELFLIYWFGSMILGWMHEKSYG